MVRGSLFVVAVAGVVGAGCIFGGGGTAAGSGGAKSHHGTKKEALTAGRELAHSKVPSQLVVHKSDGTIQESWTYDSE